jgi:ribosome maturation factor RimP
LAKHTSGRKPTFLFPQADFAVTPLFFMALDLETVRGIAERVAAGYGLEVLEVEYRGGGKSRLLRIFLDNPAGKVTHENCVSVSHEVSTILDVEDVVPGNTYTLEVSSPGMDRKLYKAADYERFTGRLVKVTTFEPVNGNRHYEGRLVAFTDGRLTVNTSDRGREKKKKAVAEDDAAPVEIALANVEKANLVPEI